MTRFELFYSSIPLGYDYQLYRMTIGSQRA
jgi:hypothetical protein